MSRVVDSAAGLTAEWLSEALETEVRSVVHERIGSGVTGAAYRLTLDRDGSPDTLVAKIAAGNAEARYRVRNGYRAEVGFYIDLAATVDIRTPRCWHAAIDDDGTRFTLLLEDLAPRAPGVQVAGCSLEQADDAVRNLAGLHAPRWDDDSLFDLAFLQRPTDARAAFLSQLASSATDAFVERYETDLDADDVATLRAAADVMEHWLRSPPEHVAPIHGDYRLDNLMFPPHGAGVVAVDWQTLSVAPPRATWPTSSRRASTSRTGARPSAILSPGTTPSWSHAAWTTTRSTAASTITASVSSRHR